MGYEVRDLACGVTVRLDSHGGDRERRDEKLAEELDTELRAALRGVLRKPKYEDILLFDPEYYAGEDVSTESSEYEPSYERQLQSQTLTAVFATLGGQMMSGDMGPAVVIDDTASVRRTQKHMDPGGKYYLYTTNVTVSVSRVEIPR